jgi:hypothetical protein
MKIDAPEGVSLVCYADDMAIVVTASTKEDMILKGNETLHSIKLWMAANKLSIAEEKTVATILNQKRKVEISFKPGELPHKSGSVGQIPGSHSRPRAAI